MRIFIISITLITVLSCKNKEVDFDTVGRSAVDSVSTKTVKDSTFSLQPAVAANDHKVGLILTSNALQTIDKETGSTREIAFGMPIDQMVKMVSSILNQQPVSVGINSECGAGPLKMASWKNGLTVIFEKKKGTDWQFAGWYHAKPRIDASSPVLTTMAGVGVGTTRAEFESAYVITVDETSLGYEFSTASGLYGILDGANSNSVITDMWSGQSCNFR